MAKKSGFTLIELLAVIVILTIILAIAVPGISGVIKSATKGSFKSDATMVLQAIEYKKLGNEGFNPLEVTKENMSDTLGISSTNYGQVNISVTNGMVEIILIGQNEWDGFTAYGSIKNMMVVDTEDYDVVPPSITILGSNPIFIGKGTVYVDEGATAADIKDGDVAISSTVITNGSNNVVSSVDTSFFGTYIVTYTAIDNQGNMATSIRRVNIVDKMDPVITLLGSNPVTIGVGSVYSDAGASALDETEGNITSEIITTGTINPSVVGTYLITYTVFDSSGNSATVTRTINVIDDIVPIIVFGTTGNSTYAKTRSTTVNMSDAHTGVDASSLKYLWSTSAIEPVESSFNTTFVNGQTITSPSGVTGSYYLWILGKDNAGNLAIARTNVFNLDNAKPVIISVGNSSVTVNKGSIYNDAGATATDNIDVSVSAVSSGSVNINIIGTYTITYTAIDASGNVATPVIRTVNVVDVSAPLITLFGANPVTLEVGAIYSDAGATATDDVDGNVTGNIIKTGTVNPAVTGTYTITYTVKDNANNQAITSRTVYVVDTTPPTSPTTVGMTYADGVTNYPNNTWVNKAVYIYGGISGSTDVGGILKYQISADNVTWVDYIYDFTNPMYGITSEGTYNRYVRAVDKAGNVSSTIVKTIKIDSTKPVITLFGVNPTMVVQGAVYGDAGATATDNVNGTITSSVVTTGFVNTAVVGMYTITYSVSDTAGNATIATRTVQVLGPHTITNLIQNSGFENGITNWSISNATLVSDIKYAGTSSLRFNIGGESMSMQSLSKAAPTYGHKYYGALMFLSAPGFSSMDNRFEWYHNDSVGGRIIIASKASVTTTWIKLASIQTLENTTYTGYTWSVRNFLVNSTTYAYTDNILFIDLTEAFGSGNEPDLAWCNSNISYFEGSTVVYK